MSKIIVARKYVKAILTKFDIKEIAEICENLDKICKAFEFEKFKNCLLYTSPSPRDKRQSRMPSSA